MRLPLLIAIALVASACSNVETKDTTAEVNANPACLGSGSQPGAAEAPWCKREIKAEVVTDGDKGEKIDFNKKDDD